MRGRRDSFVRRQCRIVYQEHVRISRPMVPHCFLCKDTKPLTREKLEKNDFAIVHLLSARRPFLGHNNVLNSATRFQPEAYGSKTAQERSGMKSAIPNTWEFHPSDASIAISLADRVLTVLIAAVATSLWGAIIGVACWAFGIPMEAQWVAGVLAVIFATSILALGLVSKDLDCEQHGNAG
jgi:hypothetical protein